jgi:hypothetical protein
MNVLIVTFAEAGGETAESELKWLPLQAIYKK